MRWGATLAALFALLWAASCAAPGGGASTSVHDLQGRALDPLRDPKAPVVLVFVDPECPISNAYAPELRRLHAEFAPRGVRFWLVYADPSRSLEALRTHLRAFDYRMGALFDPEQELVARAGATLTPEACVFTAAGALAYRGRIDDRYVAFGKQRVAPTTRDLRAALEDVLAGRPPATPWAPAIGCAIPPRAASDLPARLVLTPASGSG